MFFYKFLLKWEKMKKILSPAYSLKLKNIILFFNRALFFFQMVIFATLFRRCPTLWKSMLKMTTLFRRYPTLLVQRWKTQRCFNVILHCKFQRWHTQRCFNVGLTLYYVTTLYQPKSNVETTSKCLLGILQLLLTHYFSVFNHFTGLARKVLVSPN